MTRSWEGNWHHRITTKVGELGFPDVTTFAASRLNKTYEELAEDLGRHEVAPVQIQWLLYEEALRRNDLIWFAKDCLIRELYDRIPLGWRKGDNFFVKVGSAIGGWISSLGDSHIEHAERAWDWLERQNVPEGWLPQGPDDPWIEAMFRETGFPGAGEPIKPGSANDDETHT